MTVLVTTEHSRLLWAAVLLLLYAGLCGYIWYRWRRSRPAEVKTGAGVLLGWASQSGAAQQLAEKLQQQLQSVGEQVLCAPLDRITASMLEMSSTQLFVVSTYDEGLAPEHARTFLHQLDGKVSLQHASIQVLGLGDRRYPLFCQFARQLQERLLQCGAQLAWPLLTVDNQHEQDLAKWQASLAQRFGLPHAQSDNGADCYSATLLERTLLNPASDSPGLYLLRFGVHDAHWQPGDTIRVRPFNNPQLTAREYSIASVCDDGLELIVRLAGQCTGWLCETLVAGEQVVFQICAKPAFRPVEAATPAIFIGAGSGMAGLRGHLQARAEGSHNWLVFGERCPQTDRILSAELDEWLMNGRLQYMDYAFSCDPQKPAYVQDCLRKQRARLHEWLENGAVIYLCGSLQGLGRSVEATLVELLGVATLEALKKNQRYRTDLY